MKKVLITGVSSYIGSSFERYIQERYPNDFAIDTISLRDYSWQEKSFEGYDAVFHVAGIAHADTGHISEQQKALYYRVNTDLTIEVATKAKKDGVRQFIFMSSIIVYGESAPLGQEKRIVKNTPPAPANYYGNSKLQAEKGILPLQDDFFNVVILRPPMIYGKGCKGNYQVLSCFAQKLPFFPYINNERSIIYIENLCEFVRLMIENEESGIFFPQNEEYSNTSELVIMIAEVHGKKIVIMKGFAWALKIISHMTWLVNKAFGCLSYDRKLSQYREEYIVCGLRESIERTEKL